MIILAKHRLPNSSIRLRSIQRHLHSKTMSQPPHTAVVLFNLSNLRVRDNSCILRAHRESKFQFVLPLICLNPKDFKEGSADYSRSLIKTGLPKSGFHRTKFLLQSIECLKESLKLLHSTHQSPLLTFNGSISKGLQEISAKLPNHKITTITHVELSDEEKREVDKINVGDVQKIWGEQTLYHPSDVRKIMDLTHHGFPSTFSEFRKLCEKNLEVRKPSKPLLAEEVKPLPAGDWSQFRHHWVLSDLVDPKYFPTNKQTLDGYATTNGGSASGGLSFDSGGSYTGVGPVGSSIPTDSRSAIKYGGGEMEALKHLDAYLFHRDLLKTYKKTRNGMIGQNYSSKLSPFLAAGNISVRRVYSEIKRYERERTSNESTYWLVFELIWRDFLRFYHIAHGNRIYHLWGPRGITQRNKDQQWKQDLGLFKKWTNGKTGVPFIDASMIELRQTGFMSNRGRQNVASFLVHDLQLDWRLGAMWFEAMLIDHDPCQNYGNWTYAAGVGADPREGRYFNARTQFLRYDKNGEFVKLWIPELKGAKVDNIANCVNLPASYPSLAVMPKFKSFKQRNGSGGNRGGKGKRGGRRSGGGNGHYRRPKKKDQRSILDFVKN